MKPAVFILKNKYGYLIVEGLVAQIRLDVKELDRIIESYKRSGHWVTAPNWKSLTTQQRRKFNVEE